MIADRLSYCQAKRAWRRTEDSKTEKGSFSPQPFCFNSSIQIWWWIVLSGTSCKTCSIHNIYANANSESRLPFNPCETQKLLFSLVHSSHLIIWQICPESLMHFWMSAWFWHITTKLPMTFTKCLLWAGGTSQQPCTRTSTIQSSSHIQIPNWMIVTILFRFLFIYTQITEKYGDCKIEKKQHTKCEITNEPVATIEQSSAQC